MVIELAHTAEMPAGVFPMNWSKPLIDRGYKAELTSKKGRTIASFALDEVFSEWVQVREASKRATYLRLKGKEFIARIEFDDYAIERAKEFGTYFLKLEGSPAQVTWATRIRAKAVLELMENIPSGEFPLQATKHIFLTRSAHWWIENMDSVVADTLLSIKRWNEEPAFKVLVGSLPPLTGATVPMVNWASRLRLGCLLSINLSASNVEMALLATQLFFAQKRESKWWIEREPNIAAEVAKGRREHGKSLIRSIPHWEQCDGLYQIPHDAPIEDDVAFLQDPDGKWHIFRRELPF